MTDGDRLTKPLAPGTKKLGEDGGPSAPDIKRPGGGNELLKRMKKAKVDESDVLEAGRRAFGLEKMEDIKYAILEKSGDITIVPYR